MSAASASTPWVFGYGSLIWRPGFAFERSERALAGGVHRRLCIYSHIHRGTREQPGLVFGLERGGACVGMAFKVASKDWDEVRAYLEAREQVTAVYVESLRPVRLASGEKVEALTFVTDRNHEQYAGRLSLDEQYRLVSRAAGEAGANVDYVLNTASHLRVLGIADRQVQALAGMIEKSRGLGAGV